MLRKFLHIGDLHWKKFSNHTQLIETTNVLLDYIKANKIELLYIGGDVVDDKNKLSPELNEVLTWFFNTLVQTVDVVVVLGNHDLNLQNKDTSDSLAFFINQANKLDTPYKIYLLPESIKSDVVVIDKFPNIQWAVWSVKDDNKSPFSYPENVKKLDPTKITIGCFHGAVSGSKSDMGFEMSTPFDISMFKDCDTVLLNDIHKRQSFEPHIAYSGSWAQINFGETEEKGALLWELTIDEDKYLPKFVPLKTTYGFHTIKVINSSHKIEKLTEGIKPNDRVRIVYVGKAEDFSKKFINDIKKYIITKKLTSFTDISFIDDSTSTGKKVIVVNEEESQLPSFFDFSSDLQTQLKESQKNLTLLQENALTKYLSSLPKVNKDLIGKVLDIDKEITTQAANGNSLGQRNVITLLNMEFKNFMSYGSLNNKIDFVSLQNEITGVLGNNQLGKSTLLDAVLFALYGETNKLNKSIADLVNDHICDNGFVKVVFKNESDGKVYQVIRSLIVTPISKKIGVTIGDKESFKTSSTLQLQELGENDSWVIIQGTERQSTENILRSIVGTFDVFKLINLYSSKNPVQFTELKNSQRLALIFDYLGLQVYEKKEELAKAKAKSLDRSLTLLEGELKGLGELNVIKDELTHLKLELEVKNKEKGELEEQLAAIKEQVDKTNLQISSLKAQASYDKDILTLATTEAPLPEIHILQGDIIKLEKEIEQVTNTLNEHYAALQVLAINYDAHKTIETFKEKNKSLQKSCNEFEVAKKTSENQIKAIQAAIKGGVCGSCGGLIANHTDKEEYNNWVESQKQLIETYNSEVEKSNQEALACKALITQNQKTISSLEVLISKIEDQKNSIAGKQTKIRQIDERIGKVSIAQDLRRKYWREKGELIKLNKERETINNQLIKTQTSLDYVLKDIASLNKKQVRIKELEVEVEEKERESNLYSIYINCMGRKGVPLYLLQNYIPLLNSTINFYLIGFDFNITLMLGEGKLDIMYNVANSPALRNISMTSGMEEAITNMAFRATLFQLSNTPVVDCLAIDEAFATLDATNINKVALMLKKMSGTVFKNMFLITHREDFKDLPTYFINLKKDNIGCTYIEEINDKNDEE